MLMKTRKKKLTKKKRSKPLGYSGVDCHYLWQLFKQQDAISARKKNIYTNKIHNLISQQRERTLMRKQKMAETKLFFFCCRATRRFNLMEKCSFILITSKRDVSFFFSSFLLRIIREKKNVAVIYYRIPVPNALHPHIAT